MHERNWFLPWWVMPLVLLVAFPGHLVAADQPQWGERDSRNMVSAESGLVEAFDPPSGQNIRWSVRLGTACYSTPVIARNRVLIGTNNDQVRNPNWTGDRGVLLCLDEQTGEFVWQLAAPKLADPLDDWTQVGLVSTASVEGDRVYVLTNRGEIACLDLNGMADGNDGTYQDEARYLAADDESVKALGAQDADILWLFDLRKELNVHQHDAGHCSVLQHGRYLYACTSNGVDATHQFVVSPDAPSLVVLDKDTGQLVATDAEKIGPQIIHCTWSSPSTGLIGSRRLVFFAGGDAVVYAFAAWPDGWESENRGSLQRIWRFDCDPAAPKTNVHRWQDNLRMGPSHISGMPVFHDGRIYVTVGGDIWHGKPESHLKCIDATLTGDITQTGELWSYAMQRHGVATPAIYDGLVYVTDCGRNIHCVDAITGKAHWTHHTKGEFWASPLVADGKVFVGNRRGEFFIFAAGKEKLILDEARFDAPINASPVVANGVLYVATMSTLYAIAPSP
ncbi:MAG: PQQ-binding-like beta-propeller repeat protein [Planctomycetales bacterium]|nr:PQQ-binding-like beta-propeller repeat protein [Planctomycetales bacterium]